MAIYQSEHAKRRRQVAVGGAAGVTITQTFAFTVPSVPPGAADLIEIGFLPGGNRLLGFEVIGVGTGAATVEVALMTGTQGDALDPTRVLTGGRILPAATAISNATAVATRSNCLAVATSDADVSIGVKPSAALTAGGTITVVATYAAM